MAEHATLAPSSAGRWVSCPGSVRLIDGLPDGERDAPSVASSWGTACHEGLQTCLDDGVQPSSLLGKSVEVKHEGHPTYVHTFTQEDVSNIEHAYRYGIKRTQEYGAAALVFIEERMEAGKNFRGKVFDAESLEIVEDVTPFDNCWGTADIAMVGNGYAEIVDYKNGTWHVDEQDNMQMLLYLLGLLKRLDPATHHVQRARLTIVQPRSRLVTAGKAEVVRTWEFSIDDTLADWAVKFGDAAREAAKPDAKRTPGESQCKFCPAQAVCPDLAQSSVAALVQAPVPDTEATPAAQLDDGLVEALVRPADSLTLEQMARVLEAEPLIRSWLRAVTDHALRLMKKGEKVPGFKIVHGRRDRKWAFGSESLEDEAALLKKFGNWNRIGDNGKAAGKLKKETYTVASVISPAQAEKVIRPQVTAKTWENIEKMVLWSAGKPVIAATTDHREEMVFVSSEEAFKAASKTEPQTPTELPTFLQ
jgi:hypothetical protein